MDREVAINALIDYSLAFTSHIKLHSNTLFWSFESWLSSENFSIEDIALIINHLK